MAPPRRRSSRLNRGATPNYSGAMPSPTKLSSLLEREESPPNGSPVHMDAIVSSPVAPPNTAIPPRTVQTTSSPIKTPETVSRIHPSHEEMHPSKAQHSIVKLARSESKSRLQMPEGWRARPEPGSSSTAIAQSTPTKTRGSLPAHMSSPRFDFTFSRPDAHLSIETQKIMESVREEATKIRAQMQAERNKQGPKDEEADHLHEVGGRRIATPRGKVGRYSDVHMQAFKKMDSIAGHASVWKTKIPPNAASLKPSHSKARLNAEEPKGRADRSIRSNEDDRLENTAPGKRARKNYGDDASSARPLSRGAASASESGHSDPSKPRTPPGRPSALTTPTKASLARSASVKQMKISMIPSLSRSQSTKTIRRSGTPKVEGGNRQLTPRSRFGHLKSILHRHQPKFSNDPAQVAAGTHLPAPEGGVTCDQEWPSLPSTPRAGLRTPAVNKRVDFTPGTKSKFDLAAASPSPSRIPGLHSHRSADPFASAPSLYPSLANSPTITTRTPKPSTPGDFTFRSDRILPLESTPFRAKNPTIRQVRPSGITTPMTAFENLPPIPHGISNKKRRRADSDDEDVENVPPAGEIEENDDGPRTKKLKSSPPKEGPAGAQRKTSKMGGSAIPKPTGARPGVMGVLSMSRLQMLARPKKRR